jgi:hypothetical protein
MAGIKSRKQCRERYFNHLRVGINKAAWSPEEDELIKRKIVEHGVGWTHIASMLDGRTSNAVKNRWHYLVRAEQDDLHYNGDGVTISPMTTPSDDNTSDMTSESQQLQAEASSTPLLTSLKSQHSTNATTATDVSSPPLDTDGNNPKKNLVDGLSIVGTVDSVARLDLSKSKNPSPSSNLIKRNISNISDIHPLSDNQFHSAEDPRQDILSLLQESIKSDNADLFDTLQSYVYTQNPHELCRRLSNTLRQVRRRNSYSNII